jgi:hypothetical protein
MILIQNENRCAKSSQSIGLFGLGIAWDLGTEHVLGSTCEAFGRGLCEERLWLCPKAQTLVNWFNWCVNVMVAMTYFDTCLLR